MGERAGSGDAGLTGGCLCGGVRFAIGRVLGPFELCHCSRCRKASGSAFVAGLRVLAEDFRWLQGRELVGSYEAPILHRPPAFRSSFCTRCGSPVPDPPPGEESFEVPAGSLDADPGARPDRHIFVDFGIGWDTSDLDGLPKLTRAELAALRRGRPAG